MRSRTILFTTLLCACAATKPAADHGGELRYVFLTSGQKNGEMIETRGPDGSAIVHFSFNDRGRGPDLTTTYWTGADGIPTKVEIRGVDYFKIQVNEDFVREGDTARWKNASEQDSITSKTPAFYIALNSPPEEAALLIRAALKTKDHRLPVLPSGEIEVAVVRTQEVTKDSEKKTVTMYSVSGGDLEPWFIWLDEEQRFFAGVGGWSGVMLEGWEKSFEPLRDQQQVYSRMRLEDLAKRLTKHPEHAVVFENVAVFDAEAKKLLPAQSVVITGDKITAVGPAASIKKPADAEVIDGKGKTLLPGLWDMHVHIGDSDGLLDLAAGVTSVRDLGNDVPELLKTIKKFDDGTVLGPRVVFSGFIDGPGPYALPIGKVVANEEEMKKAIDDYKALGVEQIKLYSSLDPKLVPAAAAEAKKLGLRVSGHVPNGMHAQDFVEQGADEVQHINMLALNFLDVPDTRTPERFHAVGRETGALDLASPKVKAFIELLKSHHTVIDPTLVTFESMFTQKPGELTPAMASIDARMPINVRRYSRRGGVAPAGMEEKYKDAYTKMIALVGELYKAGVTIVAGTDEPGGFSLHRELELYVKAGIPAADVLAMATVGPARVMKHADTRGTIAPGKLADLLLVDGDPTTHMEDIRKGVWVMKGGNLYRPEDLYAAIGIARPR